MDWQTIGIILGSILTVIGLLVAVFNGVSKGIYKVYTDVAQLVSKKEEEWGKKYGEAIESAAREREDLYKQLRFVCKRQDDHDKRMDKMDKTLKTFGKDITKLFESINKKLNGGAK
jgi:peptidoglycan hydrolase CwlO-like protein